MTLTAQEAVEAIAEIEQNTPQQVKKLRSHARIAARAKVVAQPANTSKRNRFQTQGVLGDISRGGCLILFSDPLLVGDIYRLSFERSTIPASSRCSLAACDAGWCERMLLKQVSASLTPST